MNVLEIILILRKVIFFKIIPEHVKDNSIVLITIAQMNYINCWVTITCGSQILETNLEWLKTFGHFQNHLGICFSTLEINFGNV